MDERLQRAIGSGHARLSFSQLGEDGVLLWMFGGRRDGFYVDVGCHHPYRYSNTAALHLMLGWHGVNIDVEQRAVDAFRAERPGDISLCVAVGDRTGAHEATFFADGALTTLDDAAAGNPHFATVPRERRTVEVRRLGDILDEVLEPGRTIDLLNVDVEGLDLEVLASNDWSRFRPAVIAVEAHGLRLGATAENGTCRYLRERGYALVSHVGVTSIFGRDEVE